MIRRALAICLLLSPLTARAQTPPSADAGVARAPSPLQQAILRGVAGYERHAWDEAATAFREAARVDPASALPQLMLAYTAAARGDAASAQGFFREALRLATVASDDFNQGRARIGLAQLQESGAQWDPARLEWEQYVRFADGHAATVPPGLGRARMDALARRATVAQESEAVRQRIEERLRTNASGANQAAPPGTVPVPPGGPAR